MNITKCFQFLFFLLLSFSLHYSILCTTTKYSCPHDQSQWLLELNQSLTISAPDYCRDSNPKTMYWNKNTDCCSWEGVTCDKITSRIIGLDLSCAQLSGTIGSNNSLYHLSHLQRLNLGFNDIEISQVSKIFGNLTHLTHLNLSHTVFAGQLPSEILKLTELISLDLSLNAINVEPDIFNLLLTNFTMLSQVSLGSLNILSYIPNNLSSSLETIELQSNKLQGEIPQSIFHLPNLKTLVLSGNSQLQGLLPSVRWNSHATLEWLELTGISFSGEIPDSVRNLKALKGLLLSYCGFNGSLPKEIFSYMTQIERIELRGNKLIGSLPLPLPSLQKLDLGMNQLNGPISMELSGLVNLHYLDLSLNNFSGQVDVDMFSNMKQLKILDLSHNSLSLLTKNNSTLPETIDTLWLASCNITKLEFLRGPSRYYEVDLSMNKIQDVPSWLWSKWNNITRLNISYNSITHREEIHFQRITFLDIQSNLFQGPFPSVPNDIKRLIISKNSFSGVIPPSIICRLSNLDMLDLSNNNFTGTIPQCIGNMSRYLHVLDLHTNNFEGTIPTTFSSTGLRTINLHGNHLGGNIPSSLAKCISLEVLDLGNNNLNGSFPSFLGDLPTLRVLSLRSNNFHGEVSFLATTSFSKLQILDLSHNQFSSTLSANLFESLTGMMENDETSESANYIGDWFNQYKDSTMVVNKGIEVELHKILTTWDTIDLSSNKFEGEIPSSVGSLVSVRQLNFSNNIFTGEIPTSFGNLSVLESLDLSSNQLIGKIPTQLAALHFLAILNLSHNELSGTIPSSEQFQTFGNGSYIDNKGLCGFPVSENCVVESHSSEEEEEDASGFVDGFGWRAVLTGYGVGMVLGLGIGYLMIVTGKTTWLEKWILG